MRKQYSFTGAGSVALEGLGHDAALTLSLEEEAILIDEIAQDENHAALGLDSILRAEDIASAIEDVIIIGTSGGMDAPSGALMTVVADMAAAGTDIEAGEILPMADQDVPAPIDLTMESIEGIKDTLRKIWEGILNILNRVWAQIKAVFKNYAMLMTSYSNKLKYLQRQIAEARSKRFELKEGASVSVANTACGGKKAKNASDLQENLAACRSVASDTLGSGAKQNFVLGRLINSTLEKAVADVKANSNTALETTISSFIKSAAAETKSLNKSSIHLRTGKNQVFDYGKALPGDKQFIIEVPQRDDNPSSSTHTSVGDLEHYLGTKIDCISDPSHSKDSAGSADIVVPSLDVLADIAEETLGLVTTAADFLSAGDTKISGERLRMQKLSEELVKAAAPLPEYGGPSGIQNKHDVRLLLKLNTHYGLMVTSISSGMLSVVRQQGGSMESFIEKSLKQYSAKSA